MKKVLPLLVIRRALAAAIFLLGTPALRAQADIIAPNAVWSYLHPLTGIDPATSDVDFNTTWFNFGAPYNGPAFKTGPAPFDYGGITYFQTNGLTTTDLGTPASGNRYSAYFKIQFNVPALVTDAIVEMVSDDGAVIYLDGEEVTRVNMGTAGPGVDNYKLLAGPAVDETILNTLSLGAIQPGSHVMAVSLHNAAVTSSDLGFYFRLTDGTPPPPTSTMIRTVFGGTVTEYQPTDLTLPGFTSPRHASFLMNVPSAPPVGLTYTMTSQDIDLSTKGEAYFYMFCNFYDISNGSNFEVDDSFAATLEVVSDDNTVTDIDLLQGTGLDQNGDGQLTGGDITTGEIDEFNPHNIAPVEAIFLAPMFKATIPANVKTARLVITAINNSANEFFSFAGATITDVPPDKDTDGDGYTDEQEEFAGTSPTIFQSHIQLQKLALQLDTTVTPNNYHLLFDTLGTFAGKAYILQFSSDLVTWVVGTTPPVITINTNATLDVNIGPTLDPVTYWRLSVVP